MLATNFGPDPWQVKLWRRLLFFVPRANPDNERLYRYVAKWYLELDDSGAPVREIGVASDGKPLFAAPDERNFGFWTDSSEVFEKDKLSLISADDFERLWHEIQCIRESCA